MYIFISLISLLLTFTSCFLFKSKNHLITLFFTIIILVNINIPFFLDAINGFDGSFLFFMSNKGDGYAYLVSIYIATLSLLSIVFSILVKRLENNEIMLNKKIPIYLILMVIIFLLFFSMVLNIQLPRFLLYALVFFSAFSKNRLSILVPILASFIILYFNFSRTIVIPIVIYFIVKYFIRKKESRLKITIIAGMVMLLLFLMIIYRGDGGAVDVNFSMVVHNLFKTNTFYQFIREVIVMRDNLNITLVDIGEHYFYSLIPIPSSLITYDFYKYSIGVFYNIDPTVLGVPIPAFLEPLLFFGWYSIVFYGFVFMFLSWCDWVLSRIKFDYTKNYFILFFMISLIYSIVMSCHSALRSVSRLPELVLILCFIYMFLSRVSRK